MWARRAQGSPQARPASAAACEGSSNRLLRFTGSEPAAAAARNRGRDEAPGAGAAADASEHESLVVRIYGSHGGELTGAARAELDLDGDPGPVRGHTHLPE